MEKEVVKELIQKDFSEENLVKELERLLKDAKRQRQLLDDLYTLKDRLGNSGASEKAADEIIAMIR